MKVLLVSSKYLPEYSGSGYRAHNLYKRLIKKNPDINIRVICGSETNNDIDEYQYENFTVTRIAKKKFPSLSLFSFIRRIQLSMNFSAEYFLTLSMLEKTEEKPDIIHVFGQNNVTIAAINFAKKHNIPLLIELCNEMETPFPYIPPPFGFFMDNTFSNNNNNFFKVICISERLRRVCLKANIPEERIWCRPNPVDEERFHPVSGEEKIKIRKEKTEFSNADILIVYIAKYIRRKNHIFMLDVIKRLPEKYKLFLGGPLVEKGPLYEENKRLFENIKSRIEEEKLSGRVHCEHGFYKDIEKYFQMADIFAFPTKAEGLGTPMLESIACGAPVIANKIEGITDYWIQNGENGFVSPLKPELFADNIKKAAVFTEEQKEEEAKKILKIAGTSVIDDKYRELLWKRDL